MDDWKFEKWKMGKPRIRKLEMWQIENGKWELGHLNFEKRTFVHFEMCVFLELGSFKFDNLKGTNANSKFHSLIFSEDWHRKG